MSTTLWAHESDIGTVIEITLLGADEAAKDISSATTLEIKASKPASGTTVTWTAAFTTDGTDGKIRYTTVADDLDEAGLWLLQGHVAGSGFDWHTLDTEFVVRSAIGI